MSERNLTRLLDDLNTLKQQVETQADTITRYRRRNSALQSENEALQAMVGKVGITRTQGAKREGRA